MKSEEIKKLIDSFNTKEYERELKETEKRIQNIMAGVPEFKGIYVDEGKVFSQAEQQKRIKLLENRKKDIKKNIEDLKILIQSLNLNFEKIKEIAKKQALFNELAECLLFREDFSNKKNSLSSMYEKKHKKIYYKSNSKLRDSALKINNEVYTRLKNNKNLQVGEFESLEYAIDTNGYKMDSLFQNAKDLLEVEYGDKLGTISVDVERLSAAKRAMKKEPTTHTVTFDGIIFLERFKSFNHLQKNYDLQKGYSDLKTLQEKYKEVVLLSREVWYMHEIIISFSKTDIVDSQMYIELQQLHDEQSSKLHKLQEKADMLYKKSGIQKKIEAENRLVEIYQLIQELKIQIDKYNKLGNFDQEALLRKKIDQLQNEMMRILKENLEFNRKEYNINNKYLIEKQIDKSEVDKTNNLQEDQITNNEYKEEEKIENKTFDLGENLQIYRSAKYQDYMIEKVMGTELGKISFSQYLQKVDPSLTELIKIEKEREKQARNIYVLYIKYYISLQEKSTALSFEDFASENYNIDNIDIPVEYEEEYERIRKK